MKRLPVLVLTAILVFVLTVSAAEISLEKEGEETYLLVFNSDKPYSISTYTVQLEYDPEITISEIGSVGPLEVFSAINPEKGIARVVAFTGDPTPYAAATYIPLARISAKSGFSPFIRIEEIEDFERSPIPIPGITEPTPSQPLPEYISDVSYPLNINEPTTIPLEVRVPWSLPVQTIIPATLPIGTPTGTPIGIDATEIQQEVLVPQTNVEGDLYETGEDHPIEKTNIPVNSSPASLISVLFGVLIVMFIIRSRL
ncbi:hypothetical protein FTO68_01910 [Methanocalculus taiwanensis]|uniref:Uncharacterized protein n=1 Tax=Methanocalculus taiwanensis TaxID=106207 RepID=A0ABD4TFJ1_9EURY|nr:hypothetical protein [Methanocalculus taiwanensis]MCQ1537748.1 hypothetical protein [Methanocalculus taiwanensis]